MVPLNCTVERRAGFDKRAASRVAAMLAAAFVVAACGSDPPKLKPETFDANTPFSRQLAGSGEAVCWSVKKAFLSQGYILDRSDTLILTGSRNYQVDDETSVRVNLQTTCVDNKNGTSTVFATASREVSKLQRVKQSVAAGVSIATITVPAGSALELQVISRETITDPKFYAGFYQLVQTFTAMDADANRVASKDGKPAQAKVSD
jgi:hypothetical protein